MPYPTLPNEYDDMGLFAPDPSAFLMPPPPEEVVPPEEIEPPPWVPSKKFQEEARDYVVRFCNESADYIREFVDHWSLLDDLHNNKIGPRDWANRTNKFIDRTDSRVRDQKQVNQVKWFSDILYTPRDITEKVVAAMYAAIFSGPDYLTITVEKDLDIEQGSVWTGEDPNAFPIGMRAQEFLKSYLTAGQIHARICDALKCGVLYGTLAGKVSWHQRTTMRRQPDGTRLREVLEEYPVIDPIPLDTFLPDPDTHHNDTSRWRMVGHRIERTFDQVSDSFNAGAYNLNEKEFRARWQSTGGPKRKVSEITGEGGEQATSDETTWLTLWEVHGQIATAEGLIEGTATLVTDTASEHCDDGILIRLRDEPILKNYQRPIRVWHFSPKDGPLGMGIIDCNEDLIFAISQFLNQLIDNTRLTAIGAWQGPKNSSQYRHIQKMGGTIYPGMFAGYESALGDKIEPLAMPQFRADVILQVINTLIEYFERRTITQTFQGISGTRKTATEANVLQQQSQMPIETRTDLLAKSFLDPVLNLCMAMVCQFVIGDKKFPVRQLDGSVQMLGITQEELRRHKYTVSTTLTRQDASSIARAQSIERILPVLANLEPLVMRDGRKIGWSELMMRWLDATKLDGLDRVLPPITEQEKMAMMQPPPGPPQEGQQPPSGPQPPTMGEEGGPIGDGSDVDAIAQLLQNQGLNLQGGAM